MKRNASITKPQRFSESKLRSPNVRHLTRDMRVNIINELPTPFDTHDVEKRSLRLYGRAFGNELREFGDLHPLSADMGHQIDLEFPGQLRKTRKVRSENLGGRLSLN